MWRDCWRLSQPFGLQKSEANPPDGSVNFQCVIFDMDGTLLSTEILYRKAWQAAAIELGYIVSDDLYARMVGRPNLEAVQTLEQLWGSTFDRARYLERIELLYLEIIAKEGIQPRSGIPDLLEALRRQEVPMAVATSTDRNLAVQKLTTSGLIEYFSTVVGGNEVSRGKPAPDIFLLAASRLGLQPNECLVFEDSDAGVRAASAAGMRCIAVPDIASPAQETLKHAWMTFDSYLGLSAHIIPISQNAKKR